MSHRVDTLTVRCRGGTDARPEAERVRARLNSIAERHLGPALQMLLPDRDAEIATVVAPLDFELSAYDDETVAWRWAHAIAVAVSNAAPLPTAADRSAADPPGGEWSAVHRYTAEMQALADSLDALSAADVADRQSLLTIFDRLPPALSRPVGEIIAALLTEIHHDGRPASDSPRAGPPVSRAGRGEEHPSPTAGADRSSSAAGRDGNEPPRVAARRFLQRATPSELKQLADLIRVKARNAVAAAGPISTAGRPATNPGLPQTMVAGLCLLYPWLGRLVERAWIVHGSGAEIAVGAMMALVPSIDRSLLVNDPLVKVLAGVRPDTPLDVQRAVDLDSGPLEQDITDANTRFVSSLRGAWAVETAIGELVIRAGTVEDSGGVWTVRPQRRPLDFLLDTLPYPLGSFALHWTDPIAVRWPHE